MLNEENNQSQKKLRGSGGYVFAKVTDEEQKNGNLGGPELFLAGIGRLSEDRFSKYYCNKCESEYQGAPTIQFENPNEELGEDVVLIEKGQYICSTCNNIIAQYRKFNAHSSDQKVQQFEEGERSSIDAERKPPGTNNAESVTSVSRISEEFFPVRSLIGMAAYDNEAILVGNVHEIGLRKSSGGNIQIMVKISNQNKKDDSTNIQDREFKWTDISKIGDIVLLGNTKSDEETNSSRSSSTTTNQSRLCHSCGYSNQGNADFCEECGSKLS